MPPRTALGWARLFGNGAVDGLRAAGGRGTSSGSDGFGDGQAAGWRDGGQRWWDRAAAAVTGAARGHTGGQCDLPKPSVAAHPRSSQMNGAGLAGNERKVLPGQQMKV